MATGQKRRGRPPKNHMQDTDTSRKGKTNLQESDPSVSNMVNRKDISIHIGGKTIAEGASAGERSSDMELAHRAGENKDTQTKTYNEPTALSKVSAGKNVDFIDIFKEREKQRKTMEETHKKDTFLVEKELLDRLNKIAKKQKRGFKTHFINYAIRKALQEIEEKRGEKF